MNRVLPCLVWLAFCLAGDGRLVAAQPATHSPARTSPDEELVPLAQFTSALPPDMKKKTSELVNAPDIYHDILKGLANPMFGGSSQAKGFFGFLTNLNLQFKAFEPVSAGGDPALGFDYSYDRAITSKTLSADFNTSTDLSLKLHANGNVAFDRERNPDDFLDTGVSLHLFHRRGGVDPLVYTNQAMFDLNRKLVVRAAGLLEGEIDDLPEWRAWDAAVQRALRTQYLLDVAANYSLESNQRFSQKQSAYGLEASVLVRGWNPDSAWARFNLLDYPFALLRYLTGAERSQSFSPSGQALPSVVVGIDLVDPFDNDTRLATDPDDDPYPRFRADAGFKTRVARLMSKDVWFEASYRYFVEINPSPAIRQANLDEFHYFAASLEMLDGFTVTYSTGRLPLDARNDQVVALGWEFNF